MNPREMGAVTIRRLLAEVVADRRALADRNAEIDRLVQPSPVPAETQALALGLVLERAYTGVEALLARTLQVTDGVVPRPLDWHRGLVSAASLDVPGARPAILSAQSATAVDEVRKFRHFLRHAYAAPLDARRVLELAGQWQSAQPALAADLDRLVRFLEGIADRLDEG